MLDRKRMISPPSILEMLQRIEYQNRHSVSIDCPKCGERMRSDGQPESEQILALPDQDHCYHAPTWWRCEHCIERGDSDEN